MKSTKAIFIKTEYYRRKSPDKLTRKEKENKKKSLRISDSHGGEYVNYLSIGLMRGVDWWTFSDVPEALSAFTLIAKTRRCNPDDSRLHSDTYFL